MFCSYGKPMKFVQPYTEFLLKLLCCSKKKLLVNKRKLADTLQRLIKKTIKYSDIGIKIDKPDS